MKKALRGPNEGSVKSKKRIAKKRFMPEYPKKYVSYVKRAIKKGITFDLTVRTFEDIISLPCFYCGEAGGTIDRKDSASGYTIQNSLPCCIKCNLMKHTLSMDVFFSHVRTIYNYS